jgi:hypothetical protein
LEESLLDADPAVICTLDKDLRILSCNRAWDDFALANNGAQACRERVAGRPLLDFISGDLCAFYEEGYLRTLTSQESWHHEYECPSPETFRSFRMTASAVPGGLLVVHSRTVEHPHETIPCPPLESDYRDADGLMVMCSNCRRAQRNGTGEWDWIPAFVARIPANVSHGLCQPCVACYMSRLVRPA